MNKVYEDACCEVDYILEHTCSSDIEKIPSKLRDFFKNKKSKYYEVRISADIPLKEQELLDETKAIISFLNRKYLCSEEERAIRERIFIEELKKEKVHKEARQDRLETTYNVIDTHEVQAKAEMPSIYEGKNRLEKIIKNIKYLLKKLIGRA
jgi:hypothetical protein